MEKLLWVIAGALGLLGLLLLIFSPIGKVIGLCMLVLGCVLAAFLALGLKFLLRQEGAALVVRVNGSEVARYALTETGDYPLNGGTNVLHIENGSAWLTDADCPDKLCVKQGKIQYTGQTITCLPNRLTVTVIGADGGVDLVS